MSLDLAAKIATVLDKKTVWYDGELRKAKSKGSVAYDNAALKQMLSDVPGIDELTGKAVDSLITEYKNEKESSCSNDKKPFLTESDFWTMTTKYFRYGTGDQIHVVKTPAWDSFCLADMEGKEIEKGDMMLSLEKLLYKLQQTHVIEYGPMILNDLDRVFDKKRRETLVNISNTIKYNGENDTLRNLLLAYQVENLELSVEMMKHFLWQIKRIMLNLPIRFHLFPTLCGTHHGTGKTTIVSRLMGVLEGFALDYKLSDLSEKRAIAVTSSRYLCLIFDEMDGASKADISNIKNWTTAEKLTYRPMGKNDDASVTKRASGIGTANERLSSLINDSTGNRRFVELYCNTPTRPDLVNGTEWDMGGSAWMQIWQSVDETLPLGYYQPDTNKEQAVHVATAMADTNEVMWLKNNFEYSDDFVMGSNTQTLHQNDVYEDYKEYCQKYNNGSKLGIKNFGIVINKMAELYPDALLVKMRKTGKHITLPVKKSHYSNVSSVDTLNPFNSPIYSPTVAKDVWEM